jgi:hypothetical protein
MVGKPEAILGPDSFRGPVVNALAFVGDHFPPADFPLPTWRGSKKRFVHTIVIPSSRDYSDNHWLGT